MIYVIAGAIGLLLILCVVDWFLHRNSNAQTKLTPGSAEEKELEKNREETRKLAYWGVVLFSAAIGTVGGFLIEKKGTAGCPEQFDYAPFWLGVANVLFQYIINRRSRLIRASLVPEAPNKKSFRGPRAWLPGSLAAFYILFPLICGATMTKGLTMVPMERLERGAVLSPKLGLLEDSMGMAGRGTKPATRRE